MAAGVAALIVISAGSGWIASERVSSPADAAAQTAPPEPSPILVPVESRVVATDIVARGTGRFGSPQPVILPPSSLKAVDPIATWLPEVGTLLDDGGLLARVDDRPVIVLEGDIPMYRDLTLRTRGRDVEQLERALVRLGIDPGPVDGLYDNATRRAVMTLFASHELGQSAAGVALSTVSTVAGGIPRDELVFLPALPVRVNEIDAREGMTMTESVGTVTDVTVTIDSSLALDEVDLVSVGTTVMIDEPNLGITASGVVTRIDDTPGTMGVDGFHVYMEVSVQGSPPEIVGASVRLTIPVETTGTAAVAVPIAALSLAADGSSRVQVQRDEALEFVTVEPGLAADGFVELIGTGTLTVGELVVVGHDNTSTQAQEATP